MLSPVVWRVALCQTHLFFMRFLFSCDCEWELTIVSRFDHCHLNQSHTLCRQSEQHVFYLLEVHYLFSLSLPPLQIHLFTVSSSFLYTRSNGTDKSPPPNKMNIVVCKWPYSYWIWNDIRNMLLSLDESLYLCDPELLIVHFPRLWETTNWRPDHCRLACSRWIVCPT